MIAALGERDWHLAIAGIILHDTGYLKHRNDTTGSGAKYSAIHVGRSCFFAWDLLPEFVFPIVGYIDDLGLIWLSLRWLLKSAPTASVEAPRPGI